MDLGNTSSIWDLNVVILSGSETSLGQRYSFAEDILTVSEKGHLVQDIVFRLKAYLVKCLGRCIYGAVQNK